MQDVYLFYFLLFQHLMKFLNQNQFVLPKNHIFIVKRVSNVRKSHGEGEKWYLQIDNYLEERLTPE